MILITGGAGYIGSHAALALTDLNIPCIVLDNLSTGYRQLVPNSVPFIEGNVGDFQLMDHIIQKYQIKKVMHFAASVVVSESMQDPLKYYQNNVANSITLLQACQKNQIEQFIFSSTAAVYGIAKESLVNETSLTNPINPYGQSKLMMEKMIQDSGISHIILRYFNVAGSDPNMRSGLISKNATHLIKVVAELVAGKRSSMAIFGDDYSTHDGTCIRDYIHVSDLVAAHVAALDQKENNLFNCGYGNGFSVKEIIYAAEKIAGKKLNVTIESRRAGDAPALIAETKKIHQHLNWQPKYNDIEFILKSAIDWEHRCPSLF